MLRSLITAAVSSSGLRRDRHVANNLRHAFRLVREQELRADSYICSAADGLVPVAQRHCLAQRSPLTRTLLRRLDETTLSAQGLSIHLGLRGIEWAIFELEGPRNPAIT